MIVFDKNNVMQQLENQKIKRNSLISVIIKLSQIICDKNDNVLTWSCIQTQLHDDIEKSSLFDTPKNITPPIIHNDEPINKTSDTNKKLPISFIPTVNDIVSMKNSLRKTVMPAEIEPEKIEEVIPEELPIEETKKHKSIKKHKHKHVKTKSK